MTDDTDARQRRDRYEDAFSAGRAWASKELEHAGMNMAEEVKGMIDEAIAAYTALQTGRLPSVFSQVDDHTAQTEMGEGFFNGASEVLDKRRQCRPFSPSQTAESTRLSTQQREGHAYWLMNDNATEGSINLMLEIEVERRPLLEECVAQAVYSLREVAARIEAGEGEGGILDQNGKEIGSFYLFPAEQG